MANKNPVTNIEVNSTGDAYIVTFCDDSTMILPCLNCGGTTTPPGLPDNGKTRCLKIGLIAKALKDQFVALIEVNSVGGWMDQDPQQTAQAVLALTVWMGSWSVPIAFFDELRDWMLSVTDPTEWYNTHDGGFIGSGYDCLGNFIECCLPENEVLSDGFFNCLYMNFDDPQLECASGDLQVMAAYRMLSGYMQAFGNDYWRKTFFEAIATNVTTNPVNCANFEDCEGHTVGCPPDAVYAEYHVDWEGYTGGLLPGGNSIQWDSPSGVPYSTSPSCYGGGAYDPCSPYNARRGLQFFLSGFDACLRGLKFSYAGNGQTNSTKVRIYVNEELQASLTGLVGKTRCVNAGGTTPYSGVYEFAEPIPNAVSVRLEFYDLTGANPAFGLDVHCVKLDLAFP